MPRPKDVLWRIIAIPYKRCGSGHVSLNFRTGPGYWASGSKQCSWRNHSEINQSTSRPIAVPVDPGPNHFLFARARRAGLTCDNLSVTQVDHSFLVLAVSYSSASLIRNGGHNTKPCSYRPVAEAGVSALWCQHVGGFSNGLILGRWDGQFPDCVPRTRERRSREPVKTLFHFHRPCCGRQCAHGFHRMCPGRNLVPHAHCRQGIRTVMRIGGNRVSAPVRSFWKCAKEVELISIRPLA